jgi:hypothetical protein
MKLFITLLNRLLDACERERSGIIGVD